MTDVADWALVTVAQMEAELGLGSGGGGTRLVEIVDEASAICEEKTGRNLLDRNYSGDLYSGDGSPALVLRNWPITTVSVCTVDGEAQTVGDDPDTYDVQVHATHLYREAGWSVGNNNISVSYRAGYKAGFVDSDGVNHDRQIALLRRAARLIARDAWQATTTQRMEVASMGGGGRSFSFPVEHDIPPRAKAILDGFARPGLGVSE
jgi:uncharacterized phiE125 gp8 family phage protein